MLLRGKHLVIVGSIWERLTWIQFSKDVTKKPDFLRGGLGSSLIILE